MNKFSIYLFLIVAFSIFSCSSNDTTEPTPPREYPVQYTTDSTNIEKYLKTYYIEKVTKNPGETDDMDVKITQISDAATQTSIWNQTEYPLKSKNVLMHGIVYKVYYIIFRQGTGDSPTNVDGVLPSYKGVYIAEKTTDDVTYIKQTLFEEVKYPTTPLSLYQTIMGWSELFPLFKAGTIDATSPDGIVKYRDFGAGIIFIPSGLGYYNYTSGSIPSYSPLVFSIKLYTVVRLDQDGDGIESYREDLNGDGYMWAKSRIPSGTANQDDTDGDEVPDFLDIDDDEDTVSTRVEIQDANGNKLDFDKIPDCSGDITVPTRLRRYLDKNCSNK